MFTVRSCRRAECNFKIAMKIGIDARPLSHGQAGITRYLRCLIEAMAKLDQTHEYFLYSNRDFDTAFEDAQWHKRVSLNFRNIPGTVWLQLTAPEAARKDKLEIFWGTEHFLPWGLPRSVRRVLTIHDVVWRTLPETMAAYNRLVHRLLVDPSLERADLILVPSLSTQKDLMRYFPWMQAPVRVIYEGVAPHYQPCDRVAAAYHIAQKFKTSREYILSVGTLEPRKNLLTLIEAFYILRRKSLLDVQLVIAGAKGWGKGDVRRRTLELGLSDREVRFVGFVPEEDMPALYAGALVFVYPSLYEGFGLPLLEALACGAPVACSNRSSLPEIGTDAVLYFDPESPEEMAGALLRILSDSFLKGTLVRRGLERARRFSWESCARSVLATFDEVARTLSSSRAEINSDRTSHMALFI